MAATRIAGAPGRLLGALILLALAPPLPVAAAGWNVQPTARQLERLARAEPYIRYFTSLEYGRDGARVPAEYMRALVLTESSAQVRALSNRGARGLTQIVPRTGAAVVERILAEEQDYLFVDEAALEDFEPDDLYDPALNILIACRLSARYFARWKGSTELVVAAWNAGPTAVARYGDRPPPYRETRDLIARVKAYMRYLDSAYVLAD